MKAKVTLSPDVDPSIYGERDPIVSCPSCFRTFRCDAMDATCRVCSMPYDLSRVKEFYPLGIPANIASRLKELKEGVPMVGHWESLKGENHGLKSQPGDIWVDKDSPHLSTRLDEVFKGMRKDGIGLTWGQETFIKRGLRL